MKLYEIRISSHPERGVICRVYRNGKLVTLKRGLDGASGVRSVVADVRKVRRACRSFGGLSGGFDQLGRSHSY